MSCVTRQLYQCLSATRLHDASLATFRQVFAFKPRFSSRQSKLQQKRPGVRLYNYKHFHATCISAVTNVPNAPLLQQACAALPNEPRRHTAQERRSLNISLRVPDDHKATLFAFVLAECCSSLRPSQGQRLSKLEHLSRMDGQMLKLHINE